MGEQDCTPGPIDPFNHTHIMVDIETFSTRADAAILSIGACCFNPAMFLIGGQAGEFYTRVDWESSFQNGHVSPSTVRFWMEQEDEARLEICKEEGSMSLSSALTSLSNFIKLRGEDVYVWANGASFDPPILTYAYQRLGLDPYIPWKYRNVLDVRTIELLTRGYVDKSQFETGGAKHNALEDARYQATYVAAMCRAIRKDLKTLRGDT